MHPIYSSILPAVNSFINIPSLPLPLLNYPIFKRNLLSLHSFKSIKTEKLQKEKALTSARQDGLTLETLSPNFQNDSSIVSAAIGQNPLALQFASDKLKNDRKIVTKAVEQNGLTLQYASENLRNDVKLVSVALQQNGLALEYVGEKLRDRKDIVTKAVESAPKSLKFASEKWRGDKAMVLLAVGKNGTALEYASKELRNDEEVVKAAVDNKGRALKFAGEKFRKDDALVRQAMEDDRDGIELLGNMVIGFFADAVDSAAAGMDMLTKEAGKMAHAAEETLQKHITKSFDTSDSTKEEGDDRRHAGGSGSGDENEGEDDDNDDDDDDNDDDKTGVEVELESPESGDDKSNGSEEHGLFPIKERVLDPVSPGGAAAKTAAAVTGDESTVKTEVMNSSVESTGDDHAERQKTKSPEDQPQPQQQRQNQDDDDDDDGNEQKTPASPGWADTVKEYTDYAREINVAEYTKPVSKNLKAANDGVSEFSLKVLEVGAGVVSSIVDGCGACVGDRHQNDDEKRTIETSSKTASFHGDDDVGL